MRHIYIFKQPLFRRFASALRLEYYLNNHFHFISSYLVEKWLVQIMKIPTICCEIRKITGLNYQNYAKFVSRFEQEEVFN